VKNLSLKRSKTKLEQGLPIPNIKNIESYEKKEIIDSIITLSNKLIKAKDNDENIVKLQNTIDRLFFNLFDLKEEVINNLLKEYYNLQ
jgi:hypothetical protein